MSGIWRKTVALVVAVAMPAAASAGPISATGPLDRLRAGPIEAAIARSGTEIATAQRQEGRSRRRFWTSIGLLAGGGALAALSIIEIGDDEAGPDDGEDLNSSDDGEDHDGWGSKAMLGGGIAAAALGSVLLMTGKKGGPSVAVKRGGITVRQTFTF